jgi:hypothetical protein
MPKSCNLMGGDFVAVYSTNIERGMSPHTELAHIKLDELVREFSN